MSDVRQQQSDVRQQQSAQSARSLTQMSDEHRWSSPLKQKTYCPLLGSILRQCQAQCLSPREAAVTHELEEAHRLAGDNNLEALAAEEAARRKMAMVNAMRAGDQTTCSLPLMQPLRRCFCRAATYMFIQCLKPTCMVIVTVS